MSIFGSDCDCVTIHNVPLCIRRLKNSNVVKQFGLFVILQAAMIVYLTAAFFFLPLVFRVLNLKPGKRKRTT